MILVTTQSYNDEKSYHCLYLSVIFYCSGYCYKYIGSLNSINWYGN